MLNAHVLESPLDGSTIRPDKRLWKQFLRLLVIIDEFSRECLAIYVARRITSDDVLGVLAQLFVGKGAPCHLRSDNGTELTAKAVREWL